MRTSKRHLVSLIKITNNPKDVLDGNLYCNRLQRFREVEIEEMKDDIEAIAISKYLYNSYWLRIIDEDLLSCPVFCMYSLEVKNHNCPTKIQFDNVKLKKFGCYAVVITNLKEFISRVNCKLPEFRCEAVRYIDIRNPEGVNKLPIFNPIATKDKYFMYQQEFRIYSRSWALSSNTDFKIPNVKYVDESARKFSIGDLRDIAQEYPINDLFSGIEVKLKIDWDYCLKYRFQTKLPKAFR